MINRGKSLNTINKFGAEKCCQRRVADERQMSAPCHASDFSGGAALLSFFEKKKSIGKSRAAWWLATLRAHSL